MATSALSVEETNHLRAVYLCLTVAPEAVRDRFNRQHPPTQLVNDLAIEKSNLQKIKGKVLKQFQWDKLYPSTGSPLSTDFDITLLICLLRSMKPVIPPPPFRFDELPDISHTCDGAHMARIKYHRNSLAHSTDGQLSMADFSDLWNDLEMAIIGLGGSHFGQEINNALTRSLDSTLVEILRKLTEYEKRQEVLSNDVTNNCQKLKDLHTDMDNLSENLSTEQAAIKKEYERRSLVITEKIVEQENEMMEISKTVKGQISKLSSDLQELKSDVTENKRELEEVKTAMKTIPEIQTELEEVKTAMKTIPEIQTELEEVKTAMKTIPEIQTDLQEVKTEVAAMKMETIPETQRDLQEVKTDVATIKMETIPETQRGHPYSVIKDVVAQLCDVLVEIHMDFPKVLLLPIQGLPLSI